MGVRRVVTGDVDGRSRILTDGPVAGTPYWEDIWFSAPSEPLGREPDPDDTELEATGGAAKWRVFIVPPDEELKAQIVNAMGAEAAATWDGFHKTNTLDHIFVLDGEIGLQMDDGEVVQLHPGDCVVQRATNHAWRNRSDKPVRLLGVMTTLA